MKRLKARDASTTEVSDARLADFENLNAAYEPPLEFESQFIRVQTNENVSETTRSVLVRLADQQTVPR